MDAQPGPGDSPAASPPAPDFTAYAREADSRDLGRSTSPGAPADSPSAQPDGQVVSTETSPAAASEPAKPTDDKKPHNLQTRLTQLDAENAQLQERLKLRKALREELRTLERPEPARPASDPAAPPPQKTWERYKHLPGAPKVDDFDAYEDYLDARAEFIADQRHADRTQREQLDTSSRARMDATEKTIQGFHERLAQARTADPAYDSKIHAGLLDIPPAFTLPPQEVRAANVLVQEIVGSDASSALLVHFSTPEGQQEWAALMQAPTPAAMVRHFGRIEQRFLSSGPSSSAAPAAKTVTSAPAPPTTLGTKPPASADRLGAAVTAGDFLAYQAAADAADLAVRRR